ncbi:MAG TPA: serine esterase [Clostridia bacterium]|nr:serine esterase [Clostridia bacterium]
MGTLKTTLIPASRKPAAGLFIMLHGLGDSLDGCRWIPDAMNLPELSFLLVNAPDRYFTGYAWYDFTGDILAGVERSRQLLFELLNQQIAAGFPPEKIVLAGFSQGCLMSIEVGLRFPQLLAGIVGISGYVADPQKLLNSLSPLATRQQLLITHGLLDPIIPFVFALDQIRLLQNASINIQWHEFMKAHIIAGEPEIAVIREFVKARLGLP